MLRRARGAEVVGLAAHGNHQRVIRQRLRRRDFAACCVVAGRQLHGFGAAVHACQVSQAELEVVPACLRQVLDLLGMGVEAARCQLVQQRLPDVGAGTVHQRDLRLTFFTQFFAQLRGQ